MPPDPEGQPPRPDYKVYRSRPGVFSRLPRPDLSSLRDRVGRGPKRGERPPRGERPDDQSGDRRGRSILKWVGLAALAWILLSFIAFAISAQIQKGKLADGVTDELGGHPLMLVDGQTILVLGTDVRPSGLSAPGEESPEKCIEVAGEGKTPPSSCVPYCADMIMLLRAGGGAFEKLSIPRDTLAEVPGQGPQKINSAYAFGGAELQVRTVEQFTGIDIDEVAIVDFVGFRDFIDAIGGVEVELSQPVCAVISGGEENGGVTLDLDSGDNELDGDEALALARTRTSGDCDGDGVPDSNLDDLARNGFQQQILSGIKGRLTSPLRLPINFLKGPIIGWNAPKAIVSSMGGLTMPQLVLSAVIGGDSETSVLKPAGTSAAGNLIIPVEECRKKIEQFFGGEPDRQPQCSPPA